MGHVLWVKIRERPMIIVSAGVIFVLGLYLFLYRPLINKCSLARGECRNIEAEALRAREAIDALRQSGTKRVLISEKDISIAIDEFTKQGRSKGINFISIAPGKIKDSKDSKYKILPIDIKLNSTYKEFFIFLGSLEKLEKSLVTVKELNLSSDTDKAGRINAVLTVNMCLSGD